MGTEKNEVAVADAKFDLVTLTGEIAEAIAEEMDGLGSIPFDRVKIPAGGGLAFDIPGEDEEHPESAAELVGVILHHHPVNAYWPDAFSGANDAPECSSLDGKTGVVRETGEVKDCESCPFNQYKDDGTGKDCKNIHRVYLLREGNPVPLMLSLPPTSLKFLRDYLGKRVLLKGMRSYSCVTKITLKKEKNAAGITYSRAVFTFVSKLSDEQAKAAKEMADQLKERNKDVEVEADITAPAASSDNGFMNVPEDMPEELPFN